MSGDNLSRVRTGCQGRQRAGVWGQGKGLGGSSITPHQGPTSCPDSRNDKTCTDTPGPYTPKAGGSIHYEHSVSAASTPGILLSSLLLLWRRGTVTNLHWSWVLSIPSETGSERRNLPMGSRQEEAKLEQVLDSPTPGPTLNTVISNYLEENN